jgi:hypothetical protein
VRASGERWGWQCEKGVPTKIVCRNYDPAIELESDHAGTGDDGLLCVLVWLGGIEMRGVVCAVDIVPRLEGR